MRLRRAPKRLSSEPAPARATAPGRRLPVTRIILILIIVAVVGAFFVANDIRVVGEGVVQGDVVQIGPIYRSRVQEIYVRCTDRVGRGDILGAVGNELDLQALDLEYAALQADLEGAQALVEVDRSVARAAIASAEERLASIRTLTAQYDGDRQVYDRLLADRAITRDAWENAVQQFRTQNARVGEAQAAIRRAQADYDRLVQGQAVEIAQLQRELDELDRQRARVGQSFLVAPHDGTLLACLAREGQAVEAIDPVFDLFRNRTAYIQAYIRPQDIGRVSAGMRANLAVTGPLPPLSGTIIAVRSRYEALPPQLARYFWQNPEWQQYIPVDIAIEDLRPEDFFALRLGARTEVVIPVPSRLGTWWDGISGNRASSDGQTPDPAT